MGTTKQSLALHIRECFVTLSSVVTEWMRREGLYQMDMGQVRLIEADVFVVFETIR
jgi:hypothetical protein